MVANAADKVRQPDHMVFVCCCMALVVKLPRSGPHFINVNVNKNQEIRLHEANRPNLVIAGKLLQPDDVAISVLVREPDCNVRQEHERCNALCRRGDVQPDDVAFSLLVHAMAGVQLTRSSPR